MGAGLSAKMLSLFAVTFLVLASWGLLDTVEAQQFGCYPQFSPYHTGCITSSRCRSIVKSGVSQEEQNSIISLHNDIRAQFASGLTSISIQNGKGPANVVQLPFYNSPTVSDMMELVWDQELAYIAQKWADQCARSDADCGSCRQVARFTVGQNRGWRETSDRGVGADWTWAIEKWMRDGASQISSTDLLNYPGGNAISALTQILWSSTEYVGCGFAKESLRGGLALFVYVCNYGPGGNTLGAPVFRIGQPCSSCPAGSSTCQQSALCSKAGAITSSIQSSYPGSGVTSRPFGPQFQPTGPAIGLCPKDCLYKSECDPGTIEYYNKGCNGGKYCCSRSDDLSDPEQWPFTIISASSSRDGPPAPKPYEPLPSMTTTLPVKPCRHSCVRMNLQSYCIPETTDLGMTTCSAKEICCRVSIPQATPRVEADQECDGGKLACIPTSSLAQACDVLAFAADPTIMSRKCPEGTKCCSLKLSSGPCPATHSCIPEAFSRICNADSIVPGGCDGSLVCCQSVKTTSTCENSCVSGDAADFCVSLGLTMPGTCPGDAICCQGAGETKTTTPAASEMQKMPCEGSGRCMAPYLAAECRGLIRDGTFSTRFTCANPRLRCCVKRTAMVKVMAASVEFTARKMRLKSAVTSTSCGETSSQKSVPSGQKAPTEWCWTVEVVSLTDQFLCYGVLFEVDWVSTAASCFIGMDTTHVAGRFFLKLPWRTEKLPVSQIITHPAFAPETLDFDLALVQLTSPIPLENVGACLICIADGSFVPYQFRILAPFTKIAGVPRGLPRESVASLLSPQSCAAGFVDYSESAPMPANAICVSNLGPLCPSKGAPVIGRNAEGIYIIMGHHSYEHSCSPSGALAVFTNMTSNEAVDFMKASLSAPVASNDDASSDISRFPLNGLMTAEQKSGGGSCSPLGPIAHGSFRIVGCDSTSTGAQVDSYGNRTDCLRGNVFPMGTLLKYECDSFYSIVGQEWRRCEKSGTWSSAMPPSCEPVCGRRYVSTALATRGTKSKPGEWPWLAALYSVPDKMITCSGSLIKEDWVLTAAHCVTNEWNDDAVAQASLVVYLGKISRASTADDEFVQIREVTSVIRNRRFNKVDMDSDIALIRLKTPAVLTTRVQLVCIPERPDVSSSNLAPGSIGSVAGWGFNEFGNLTDYLVHIKMPVVSMKQCREETIATTSDAGATRALNSNMFCAGYGMRTKPSEFRTVCPGDSGGPLVFQEKGSADDGWHAEGIVSFYMGSKIPCGERGPGMFVVFTSVFAKVPNVQFSCGCFVTAVLRTNNFLPTRKHMHNRVLNELDSSPLKISRLDCC